MLIPVAAISLDVDIAVWLGSNKLDMSPAFILAHRLSLLLLGVPGSGSVYCGITLGQSLLFGACEFPRPRLDLRLWDSPRSLSSFVIAFLERLEEALFFNIGEITIPFNVCRLGAPLLEVGLVDIIAAFNL